MTRAGPLRVRDNVFTKSRKPRRAAVHPAKSQRGSRKRREFSVHHPLTLELYRSKRDGETSQQVEGSKPNPEIPLTTGQAVAHTILLERRELDREESPIRTVVQSHESSERESKSEASSSSDSPFRVRYLTRACFRLHAIRPTTLCPVLYSLAHRSYCSSGERGREGSLGRRDPRRSHDQS